MRRQLWETTLNPRDRLLKLVEIEDARMASGVTEMLMGSEVPPRTGIYLRKCDEAELISKRRKASESLEKCIEEVEEKEQYNHRSSERNIRI